MKIKIHILVLTLLFSSLAIGQVTFKEETKEEHDIRMKWWLDAKFGLFVHYGLYSILGGEWKGETVPRYAEWIQRWGKIPSEEYISLASDFNPKELDADLWVRTAKEAGMKYMVITTKHHEGFCLWDSKFTEFDLGEGTTFNRDILAELSAACKKYGIEFGTYYSIIDWHHPSQRADLATNQPPMNDKEGYVKYMKAQLKELITKYHPSIMWFDGDWVKWWTLEDGIDLYNYLRKLDPKLIINNRVAKRKLTTKDFGTPENATPGVALDYPWEACWTVNHSWGYKKSDTTWKSPKVLIQKQIDINSKGGNLLLNVGPKADGSFPEASISLLKEMGTWNKTHQEAVYKTEYVDLLPQSWGKLVKTQGSNNSKGEIFAYVYDWPKYNLIIKGVSMGEFKAYTYQGKQLPVSAVNNNIKIDVSSVNPSKYATVLRIKYSGGIQKINKTSSIIGLDLKGDELVLQASEAKLTGNKNKIYQNSYIGSWTSHSDTASWKFDVPAPGKYLVKVIYACDEKSSGGDVMVKVDGNTITKTVTSTKGWQDYQLLEIGTLNLNQVGSTTCTIGFGNKKSQTLFNLKSVLLIPVTD